MFSDSHNFIIKVTYYLYMNKTEKIVKNENLDECHVICVAPYTVELQWLGHIWNHESMFETGVICVYHRARSRGLIWDIFSIFLNMKVRCVFSLESPYRFSQFTIFSIKKKITLNCPKSAATGFSLGTQKQI